MLSCEKCNYIMDVKGKYPKGAKYVCELTGYVFYKDIEDYDMETHPCYVYEYKENIGNSGDLEEVNSEVLEAV